MAKSLVSTLCVYPLQPSRGRRNGIADGRFVALLFLDPREEASQSEELWYLDPIRLAFRYPQHVQGVP